MTTAPQILQKALSFIKNKLHKLTNAVFGPHQTTAAQYTLRHQKPLFFPHFSPLHHQGGHANENPSRRLVHTSSIFFRPDNRSTPKMQSNRQQQSLVALYRAMRLRFGHGFESRDANSPRNVKDTKLAKHRPVFLPPLLLVGGKELVLKVPKRGQFHAAICMTI